MNQLRPRVARNLHHHPWRAALAGWLSGFLLPALSLLLDRLLRHPQPSWSEIWALRHADPAFWLLALAPFLAAAGAVRLAHWRYQKRLASREQGFLQALIGAVDGILLLVGEEGRVLHANHSAYRIMGLSSAEVLGRPIGDFLSSPGGGEEVSSSLLAGSRLTEAPRFPLRLEGKLKSGDGKSRRVTWSISPLPEEVLEESLFLCTGIDITERHELQERLVHQAHHDPLTGLANRGCFRQKVQDAMDRKVKVGLLFIDLDGFKPVNDTLGHAAGDELLLHVSRRILNAVRGSDTAARLGGDEFAVLLENIPSGQEAVIVTRRVLSALQQPFHVAGRKVRISGSVGVAHASSEESADRLLSHADAAMYMAKRGGKSQYVVYTSEMHERLLEERHPGSGLEWAIEQGHLALKCQPIVELGPK